jgi:uncharacterized repeat protein (TIGR02543 family)
LKAGDIFISSAAQAGNTAGHTGVIVGVSGSNITVIDQNNGGRSDEGYTKSFSRNTPYDSEQNQRRTPPTFDGDISTPCYQRRYSQWNIFFAAQRSGKFVSTGLTNDNAAKSYIWEGGYGSDQKFMFERQSDNTYAIKRQYSNKVLDVLGIILNAGASVGQWDWYGGNQQRWYIVDCVGGWYKLVAKHSGQVLDVKGNGNDNGIVIQQYPDNGSDAQRFKLVPYVAPDATAPTLSAGKTTRDSANTATVSFTSDEAGSYYYAVVESGAPVPTINTSGSGNSMKAISQSFEISNLTSGAAQDIYIVSKDAAGNVGAKLKLTIAVYSYTVTLDPNGGTVSLAALVRTPGANVGTPPTPTRAHYVFDGWYTSATGGTRVITTTKVTASITSYAHWKPAG